MPIQIILKAGKITLNTDIISLKEATLQWIFLTTSSDAFLYPLDIITSVAGAAGCATSSEAKDHLDFASPAPDESAGTYARVSVFDENFTLCAYYHWFVVG